MIPHQAAAAGAHRCQEVPGIPVHWCSKGDIALPSASDVVVRDLSSNSGSSHAMETRVQWSVHPGDAK